MKTKEQQLQGGMKQYNHRYKKAWPQMVLLYGIGVAILSNLSTNIIDRYAQTIYNSDGYIIYSSCVLGLTVFAIGGLVYAFYIDYFRPLHQVMDKYMAYKRRPDAPQVSSKEIE